MSVWDRSECAFLDAISLCATDAGVPMLLIPLSCTLQDSILVSLLGGWSGLRTSCSMILKASPLIPRRSQIANTRAGVSSQPSLGPKQRFWNMLMWDMNCGRMLTCSSRRCGGTCSTPGFSGGSKTSPRSWRNVALPLPGGPTTATSFPCGISKEILLSTGTPPPENFGYAKVTSLPRIFKMSCTHLDALRPDEVSCAASVFRESSMRCVTSTGKFM
mmetsp:Transcript_78569/g.217223  ORF Transcript_78569/g.217223 Transcript_78569/m.217223 type:complete len:217 (-) Transcript_78569:610-1260(-)